MFVAKPKHLWANDDDHRVCMGCAEAFTFFRRRHHCRKCGGVYCSTCCRRRVPSELRVCGTCGSPLLRLPLAVLQYILLFLPYTSQDDLLRVCRKFVALLYLPYERIQDLHDRFSWKDPRDVIHISPRSVVLRVQDRTSKCAYRALKIIPKAHMLSRRLWQRLQQYIDIVHGAKQIAFPHLFGVLQTTDYVVLVLEMFERHESLERFAIRKWRSVTVDEVLVIVQSLLQAVSYLHGRLRVAHRAVSFTKVLIEPSSLACKLVGLRGMSTFGQLPQEASYLQYLKQQRAVSNTSVGPSSTKPRRPLRAPPPLDLPVDEQLKRKSEFFTKIARERKNPLELAVARSSAFPRMPELSLPFDEEAERMCTPRQNGTPEMATASNAKSLLVSIGMPAYLIPRQDVYGVGNILLRLLRLSSSQHPPRTEAECKQIMTEPWSSGQVLHEMLKLTVPVAVMELLVGLLQPDPHKRWTADRALQHSVFQGLSEREPVMSPPPVPQHKRQPLRQA